MNDFTFLFRQDGWVIALVLFAGCLGAAELGYWLSKREIDSDKRLKKEHLSAVQTAVAALLGLLLAFSVSMAVSRFEARKVAVVDEANAIGTAYLRAALLPESQHAELNEAFKRYTDVRLELARPDWYLAVSSGALEEQSALQRQLFTLLDRIEAARVQDGERRFQSLRTPTPRTRSRRDGHGPGRV